MKAVFVVVLAVVATAGCDSPAQAAPEARAGKPSAAAPELQGLTPAQRQVALTALGGEGADCGCGDCQGACKTRTLRLQQVAALAKAGKSAAEIQAEVGPCGGCPGDNGEAPRAAANANPAPVQVTVPANAPRKGAPDARVTVVVFSDFQCPYCTRGEQVLKQLTATYGDRVRVVFRNFPLPMHPAARTAAAAALAAHEQGKFWEYHDLLFAHQDALGREALEGYARQLGLDLTRFRAALDSGRFDADLAADLAEAARLGVTGTPTFFVNGRRIVGAQPFEVFKAQVDEALNAR
jgi:protein-disulfide isomerase